MDIYSTEEEQAEAVKKWIKENGAAVIIGASLGLGALFGWRYWQANQINSKALASEEYDVQVMNMSNASLDSLESKVIQYSSKHSSKVYNNFLKLRIAKKAVESDNYEVAIKNLKDVLNNSAHEGITHIARLRLARLLIVKDQSDEAINLLNAEASTYKALYAEVRGDAYLAKGDVDKARINYHLAQTSNKQSSQNLSLQMKIDALPKTTEIKDSGGVVQG